MKVTKVESIPLRVADVDATANDGAQETIVVKIHTDEGFTGIGEVDASAWMVKAVLEGLKNLRGPDEIAHLRGKDAAEFKPAEQSQA